MADACLTVSAQAFGCVLIWIGEALLAMDKYEENTRILATNMLMAGAMLVAVFLILFVNTEMKRQAVEAEAVEAEEARWRNPPGGMCIAAGLLANASRGESDTLGMGPNRTEPVYQHEGGALEARRMAGICPESLDSR